MGTNPAGIRASFLISFVHRSRTWVQAQVPPRQAASRHAPVPKSRCLRPPRKSPRRPAGEAAAQVPLLTPAGEAAAQARCLRPPGKPPPKPPPWKTWSPWKTWILRSFRSFRSFRGLVFACGRAQRSGPGGRAQKKTDYPRGQSVCLFLEMMPIQASWL